jgi:tRNA (cmo5U34)-methyltransferase
MFAARYSNATFTLVDVAPEMLEQARRRLGEDPRFSCVVADIAQFTPARAYHVVASALAIHHLASDEKRALFARLFHSLHPGGVFVNADQVLAPTSGLARHYEQQWIAAARALGVSDNDLAAAQERMKHDRCDRLEDQLGWLRDTGFTDVDCVYKHGFFAVIRGTRA